MATNASEDESDSDIDQLLREMNICCSVSMSSNTSMDASLDEEAQLEARLQALRGSTPSPSRVLPTLADERGEIDKSKHDKISLKDNILPSNDQDIVRYLINKQKFDGLWDLDSDIIIKLTGKDLTEFRSRKTDIDAQILSSVIVILTLETRFSAFSSLWYGIVQKGRDRISDLLGKDSNKIDQLFNDLRNEL
jgi:hypothetical protein